MTAVFELDGRTATEMIAGTPGITLVDFTAEWCAPCRALAPVLEQLAFEEGGINVVKVDVEAAPDLAAHYQVMSFPTLIFFVDGQPVRRLVGSRGIGSLREELHRVRDLANAES